MYFRKKPAQIFSTATKLCSRSQLYLDAQLEPARFPRKVLAPVQHRLGRTEQALRTSPKTLLTLLTGTSIYDAGCRALHKWNIILALLGGTATSET